MLAKIELITQSKKKKKCTITLHLPVLYIGPVVYLCLWGEKQYIRASCT